MHYVVLTKGVPDFREGQVEFDEDGHLKRGSTPTVMNPNDKFALQAALQMKVKHGGRVSLGGMGPPDFDKVLEEGMRDVYADDLYLFSSREFAAADTWATSITLATAIKKMEDVDIVFAGFKTADGETGHTGLQTDWCLDRPVITHVIDLEYDEEDEVVRARRLVEGDPDEIETVEAPTPAVIVTDPEFEPRYEKASHLLKHKQLRKETQARADNHDEYLTTWDHVDLNLDGDYVGLSGSPTLVSSVDPIPKAPAEREVTYVEPDDEEGMNDVLESISPLTGD
ncbi:MAG: electron transfer flavoprotein subunit beta/FixA family protein [Halobacteria archaeon]|nr:electron transfer flavoprotein subunit beta/FixA family protein [Halobacteria archaeon]